MSLRMNAGYIITDNIRVGDVEFVLGVNSQIGNDFVTWRYANGGYFWGHYHSDLFKAQKDLVERAAERVTEIQRGLDAKEAMKPSYSPWGKVQTCKELCDGVYSVSTASHGGIMAHQEVVDKVLSVAAQKCGFVEGRYLCFEEDCDAPVAIQELMDRKLYKAPVNGYYPPEQYKKIIEMSLQAYHPDYWTFRKTHLLKALQNRERNKTNKERER